MPHSCPFLKLQLLYASVPSFNDLSQRASVDCDGNLVSTTPRFHHPLCLWAHPLTLIPLLGASSSIPSSALAPSCFTWLFHRRLFFPRVQILSVCGPPSLVSLGSTQQGLFVSELHVLIPPAPPHPGHPTRRQLVLALPPQDCSSARTGRWAEPPPLTLLVAVSPRVEIVELTASSTLVTGTPPLLADPG